MGAAIIATRARPPLTARSLAAGLDCYPALARGHLSTWPPECSATPAYGHAPSPSPPVSGRSCSFGRPSTRGGHRIRRTPTICTPTPMVARAAASTPTWAPPQVHSRTRAGSSLVPCSFSRTCTSQTRSRSHLFRRASLCARRQVTPACAIPARVARGPQARGRAYARMRQAQLTTPACSPAYSPARSPAHSPARSPAHSPGHSPAHSRRRARLLACIGR